MRPLGSAEELERRRLAAVAAVKSGIPQSTVARTLGVAPNSVWRWVQMERQGHEKLAALPHPGRKRLMDHACECRLTKVLQKGARAYGWPDDLWTAPRVTEVIRKEFQIQYHVEHVRYLLKNRLGWSSQRPELRARERNERQIQRWKREELPRIKKRSTAECTSRFSG